MHFLKKINRAFRVEMKVHNYKRKVLLATLHTLWLIILTFGMQYTSLVKIEETVLFKWSAVIQHNLMNRDKKPLSDSVVFIDVSKDLGLAPAKNIYDSVDSMLSGAKLLVIDRVKLAAFFKALNAHRGQYKFVLCDVMLNIAAPGDSMLRAEIEQVDRIITPSTWDNDQLLVPRFKVPYANIDYVPVDDKILTKMPVYGKGNVLGLPMAMHEMTDHVQYARKWGLVFINDHLTFNTILPEFYYRERDLIRTGETQIANTHYMGELFFDDDFFDHFLKDKYIVLGDFSNDLHATYLNDMPGALVLWNSFLTVKMQKPIVSFSWFLLLFVVYFAISYWIIIHPHRKFNELHDKVQSPFLKEFASECVSFIGVLFLVNIITLICFGTFISILYVAVYLTLLHLAIEKWSGRKKQRQARHTQK